MLGEELKLYFEKFFHGYVAWYHDRNCLSRDCFISNSSLLSDNCEITV
jgi:hypothetical protein